MPCNATTPLALALALALPFACSSGQEERGAAKTADAAATPAAAPAKVGYDLRRLRPRDGETLEAMFERLRGRALADDKRVAVLFSADWCAPCKRESSTIADQYDRWRSETGVKLIAVSIDDARSTARVAPYVNGQDWDYEVYLDPNGDLKRALNVNNVPHTFLLNGKGEVVYQHNNYEPGDEKELYQKVRELVGKK